MDSSALIATLRRAPEADSFPRVIATADGCLLSSVNLLETGLVLAGRSGDAASCSELDALIARAAMRVVAQDAGLAEAARSAFLRFGKAAVRQLRSGYRQGTGPLVLPAGRPRRFGSPTPEICWSRFTEPPKPYPRPQTDKRRLPGTATFDRNPPACRVPGTSRSGWRNPDRARGGRCIPPSGLSCRYRRIPGLRPHARCPPSARSASNRRHRYRAVLDGVDCNRRR